MIEEIVFLWLLPSKVSLSEGKKNMIKKNLEKSFKQSKLSLK